jgi:hypothetical protein
MSEVKDGSDGLTPTREELLALIQPLIPKVPDLKKVRELLKKVNNDNEEIRKAVSRAAKSTPAGSSRVLAGPNVNQWQLHIISDQFDGSNRTFTMPTARQVWKIEMSQHPFNLYEDSGVGANRENGFTVGRNSITLNAAAPTPELGQSGAIMYIK